VSGIVQASRARLAGAGVVGAALGALGFWGPLAGPGYEQALVAGLIVPPVAAVASAVELAGCERHPFDALTRALGTGASVALVGWLAGMAHGVRVGFCDAGAGSVLYLLGPGVGAALAGVWGALAAELARGLGARLGALRGRKPAGRGALFAAALGLAGPLASIALQVAWFRATPMIFAFDPFVGYFSGALYDTVLDHVPLVTYRAASAATLFACYVAALHLERDEDGSLAWRSLGRPGLVALGALCALASAASVLMGDRLGHWQTRASIARALGGRVALDKDCTEVLHDVSIPQAEAWRLLDDTRAHVVDLERWLGLEPGARCLTVFLFADAAQKRRLMGAAQTNIAKPWRREVYLQAAGYPHPVLGHELAHVLAGEMARGPFLVAGALGGWLPSPGLIEGLAVAASVREDELDTTEWAAAMRRIGVLPRVRALFSLGFLGGHAATSYTAAGAFVAFVRERFGTAAIRRWYGGGELTEITGESWGALERAWWDVLDGIEIGPAALAHARARFDRPGVLARRCPHVVDESMGEAAGRLRRGDLGGAERAYARALALDPSQVGARLGLATCRERAGWTGGAEELLRELAEDPAVVVTTRLGALERLGDLALRSGDVERAREQYARALSEALDEDRARTLEVKRHYAADAHARPALLALLVGTTPLVGPDAIEAADRIGAWRAAAPDDGTPSYLFGRQHASRGDHALAAARFDEALARPIPLARVRAETLRLRLRAACALGDATGARALLARYRAEPGVARARLRFAEALVARCGRAVHGHAE
jgi:tetratricopeptide (TPR) repeat protein